MSAVDQDAWTCPRCAETTRGSGETRHAAQRACRRRHRTILPPAEPTPLAEPTPPPAPLAIPAAPTARRWAR